MGGANTQFVTVLVLPFVCLFFVCVFFAPRPGHTAGPITTHDGSYDVFPVKVVPFGGLDDER